MTTTLAVTKAATPRPAAQFIAVLDIMTKFLGVAPDCLLATMLLP
jgi:hypothetical protein